MHKEKAKLAMPAQKFVVRYIGNHPLKFMRLKGTWAAVVTDPEKETVFKSFDEAQDRAREVLPWGQFKVVAKEEGKKTPHADPLPSDGRGNEDSKTKNGGKKNEQKK